MANLLGKIRLIAIGRPNSLAILPMLLNLPCPQRCTPLAHSHQSKVRLILKDCDMPQPPKLPPTPYILYFSERARERKHLSGKRKKVDAATLTTEIAQEWNALKDTERARYHEKYKHLVGVYLQEMEVYRSVLTKEQLDKYKSAKNSVCKAKNSEKQRYGKPLKPKNPFQCFVTECKADINKRRQELLRELLAKEPDPDQATKDKKIKVNYMDVGLTMWHNMSGSEQLVYNEKSKMEQAKYRTDIDNWERQMIVEGNFSLLRKSTTKAIKDGKLTHKDLPKSDES